MKPFIITNLVLAFANQLRFRNLFFLVVLLFVMDLVIPDFIPFFDEIFLGLLAILLANWKKKEPEDSQTGPLIEGEVTRKEGLGSGPPVKPHDL